MQVRVPTRSMAREAGGRVARLQACAFLAAGNASPSWEWLGEHRALLAWMAVLSVGSLVLVAALLPVVVVRLPADYFLSPRAEQGEARGALGMALLVARNVLGALFVLAGIAMLVLPGQGILTVLIGLLLLDFPGKRGLELRLVRRPRILRFINRLRARKGQPPLRVDRQGTPGPAR